MKTTPEMIAVMQAYVDGKEIEALFGTDTAWIKVELPFWDWQRNNYRIREVPDSIDWSHVAPGFNWMARDEGGIAWLFSKKPPRSGRFWLNDGMAIRADYFASYRRGTTDGANSLVSRPDGEKA